MPLRLRPTGSILYSAILYLLFVLHRVTLSFIILCSFLFRNQADIHSLATISHCAEQCRYIARVLSSNNPPGLFSALGCASPWTYQRILLTQSILLRLRRPVKCKITNNNKPKSPGNIHRLAHTLAIRTIRTFNLWRKTSLPPAFRSRIMTTTPTSLLLLHPNLVGRTWRWRTSRIANILN